MHAGIHARRRATACLVPCVLTIALLFSGHASAQNVFDFDAIAAQDELDRITEMLGREEVGNEELSNANTRVIRIESAAANCVNAATEARLRREERFEPFKDPDDMVADAQFMAQRNELRAAIDEAISAQARCESIAGHALALATSITSRQNLLSQQFLSSRADNIVELIAEFPARAATWPGQLRKSFELRLRENVEPIHVFWLIIAAGLIAALAGVLLRQFFRAWYFRGGGDDAKPRLRYLLPKPVAEFAPLWLTGLAFAAVLHATVVEPDGSMLVIRLAYAILIFGAASIVINWATGPLSPSAQVKGLIPDHVVPLRLRLRLVFLTISASYVVLGSQWLSVRIAETYVSGRTSMIFLVGVAFLVLFAYLPRIPGVQGRYRVLRVLAIVAITASIVTVLFGYQNFAAFLIHGVTRTTIALFFLWIMLWLVYVSFDYLIKQETPTAAQVRASLGISKTGSGTGIGFMRLIADLVLWFSFIVYMIYVWDDSGVTLNRLYSLVTVGEKIGNFQFEPMKIVGAMLVFAFAIVLIGWMKRWIDRRWLQHIVMERGARDAIITLFGYVGFIAAVLIALAMAEVDLTGLAIVSGALALGIGFGMQEIANNFVSGLILLFERPIRAGDFVTVGDIQGFVRSIRIRATEIETLDNQNVLVPNSELVSGRVTNWVLRDTYGRLLLRVGVAYGSDVERVRDILENVAREHPEVITDGRAPAPRALFMGFGDSSLDFELRVRVQRIERRFSVMSDLNFAVDAAFRDAGITIPFPQRDLHIVSYPETQAADASEHKPAHVRASTSTGISTRSHRSEMTIATNASDVWAALTHDDALTRWLIREGEFSPHIGGAFSMTTRDGYEMRGRIDVFIPPRRMRAVLAPAELDGPLPSGPITIEFLINEEESSTDVTVTIEGIPDSEDWEEFYRLSEDRWNVALAELKVYLLDK